MSLPDRFRCYFVEKDAQGQIKAGVTQCPLSELPRGDVLIRVAYSSLNYKDGLAATGHPGVAKALPHVPGVDAAGTVAESQCRDFSRDDPVLVTGYGMGAQQWGGLAEYVRVPHQWVVPLPEGLSLREAMIIGSAGLTAALCVDALQKHGVLPGQGPVVVTGASGGVGSMAVAILGKLGYHVAAVTGKASAHEYLTMLGAREVLPRSAVDDRGGKPLLSARWAGAVDTVGSNILGTILRAAQHDGCVTAVGLAAGNDLPVTVFPFILRGVSLIGIDTALTPMALRQAMWRQLAGPWRPPGLEMTARTVELADVGPPLHDILEGRIRGRVVVSIAGEEDCGK